MLGNIKQESILLLFVSIFLFGSFTVVLLATNPPLAQEGVSWRKPLVGSLFASICTLGIIAIFFPGRCSEISHARKMRKREDSEIKPASLQNSCTGFRGHHVDCGRFSSHLIRIGEHVLCAACTGLLLGSLVSILGTVLYFFAGWDLERFGMPAVLVGQVGILLGLIQFRFAGYARLALNAFYVLSALLTLAGTDQLSQNLSIDLYVIGVVVFWIWTRILLSQWDHSKTCRSCQSSCKLEEK